MATYEIAKAQAQSFANRTGKKYCIYKVANGDWHFSTISSILPHGFEEIKQKSEPIGTLLNDKRS